jgi:hypothetical protein
MSTFEKDIANDRARAEAETFAALDEQGWYHSIQAFPEIEDNIANRRMVEEYCRPHPISLAIVQYAFEFQDLASRLSLQTEADERKTLVNRIIARSQKDPARKEELRNRLEATVHYDDYATGKRVDVRPILDNSALRQRASDQKNELAWRKMSTAELHEEVKRRNPPAAERPKKTLGPEHTRESLIKMPRVEYRRLLASLGGGDVALGIVNDRIQGRS